MISLRSIVVWPPAVSHAPDQKQLTIRLLDIDRLPIYAGRGRACWPTAGRFPFPDPLSRPCPNVPRNNQQILCHEHVEGSETERSPSRPHTRGIVYLLTSNFTGRRQHLSNAVLKLFYLTGASLNICKWLCTALLVFSFSRKRNINTLVTVTVTEHWPQVDGPVADDAACWTRCWTDADRRRRRTVSRLCDSEDGESGSPNAETAWGKTGTETCRLAAARTCLSRTWSSPRRDVSSYFSSRRC